MDRTVQCTFKQWSVLLNNIHVKCTISSTNMKPSVRLKFTSYICVIFGKIVLPSRHYLDQRSVHFNQIDANLAPENQ
jgi:hypothetical protein